MTLPLCAKTEAHDQQSTQAMAADGWREIGCLVDFAGDILPAPAPFINLYGPGDRLVHALRMASMIKWSGRLFRDPQVPHETALLALSDDLAKADDNGNLLCCRDGFIMISGNAQAMRIGLIGVVALQRGVAKALIRYAAARKSGSSHVMAGTYSDNQGAQALYRSLGMEPYRSRLVWHK